MTKVKIYSSPTCTYCVQAKEFFKKNNVTFTDIDVSKDKKAAEEAVKKSGQMVTPIIEIDGEIIVGFDEEKLRKALKLS